jgi:hypothetical protein
MPRHLFKDAGQVFLRTLARHYSPGRLCRFAVMPPDYLVRGVSKTVAKVVSSATATTPDDV